MESRKSKKTRSYGEAPHRPRTEALTGVSTASSTSSRPLPRDRTHSEPVIPQSSTKVSYDAKPSRVQDSRVTSPTIRRHQTTTIVERSKNLPSTSTMAMPELSFAVVGSEGSGKSTFIRCALDLKKPATSPVSSKKMSLEGDVFLIKLVEIPINTLEVLADQIRWPDLLDQEVVPRIDGVLALYDVTERQSIRNIPKLLVTTPPSNSNSPRARAMTTSHFSNALNSSHSHHTKAKHGRATSELTRSNSQATFAVSLSPGSSAVGSCRDSDLQEGIVRKTGPRSPAQSSSIPSSPTEVESSNNGDDLSPNTANAGPPRLTGPGLISTEPMTDTAIGIPPKAVGSFLEDHIEDSEETTVCDQTLKKTIEPSRQVSTGRNGDGFSFDDLVDRLLSPPMSKSDAKFAAVFLCLYRKFAAPAQLLSGIVRRFESLTDNDESQLIRTGSQLRYLAILAQWVEEYPGDFAHPLTRRQMSSFVSQIGKNRVFAVAAKEMSRQLEAVSEDDDTDWACSDTSRGRANTLESFSSVVSMRGVVTAMLADSPGPDSGDTISTVRADEHSRSRLPKHSKTPSAASSTGRSGSQSALSFSLLLSSLEAAQRQAELLSPATRIPLTKEQWHLFMDVGDEEIARELTRIDWIMYTSIRPRDLIRHVSLSAEQKEKCHSLEHVHRMINQFNHVAFWVANMILLRDKSKHRARALEKFMSVAWKLRQMNNYNSLGAVIAGINGTAVHRLAQTRELVSQQAQKEFMRLEILMGTQKSHFAYRLAWENTTTERIPFLPLHRRDLVSAEEGNRTFVGENLDRINWRKFEIMGDVIVGIQRSQGTPYPNISRNMDMQRLILDGKFSKDDDVSCSAICDPHQNFTKEVFN
ncbi:hypothetical protein MMC11_007198 [Xylographa trunciseda]|nr:hypothetical protein [Xylographa trunciseda]